ncbi:MAG: Na+/H+ antiporter subunit E [Paludibacter sp.]|jgi:multicomponent Na+:H+ antiporter subunit E|nr:Na+/H+ antiporter subunit E [Paludibacter sp.]
MKAIRLIYYIPEFLLYYLIQLLKANFQMAYITLSPKMNIKAGFVEYSINLHSSGGLLMLCNLISMTPGTISVDVDEHQEVLLVHVLSNSSNETILQEINSIERRIIRLIN